MVVGNEIVEGLTVIVKEFWRPRRKGPRSKACYSIKGRVLHETLQLLVVVAFAVRQISRLLFCNKRLSDKDWVR